MRYFLLLLFLFNFFCSFSQNLRGRVIDDLTNAPIIGAIIRVQNAGNVAVSDSLGIFYIRRPQCTICTIIISSLTYDNQTVYDLDVSSSKENYIEIKLKEKINNLNEVVIRKADFHKTLESPVSLKNLSASEIQRMPGGLRDISRVLQAFPGVVIAPAWRNDLIVRGGGSFENKFYLDGIPIPNINHFTPQGSSGGAYGIINPNYLKDVDFYSGAFPSNRGNALSSVIDLKLKDGNPKKQNTSFIVGSTDLSIFSDGFINRKITYLSSIRFSNWRVVSKVFGLPVLPRYFDGLLKLKYNPTPKTDVTFIGITTSDYVEPNLEASKGPFVNKNDETMISTINTYLKQVNVNKQNSYTIGVAIKHYYRKSNISLAISQYSFDNYLTNNTNQYSRNVKNKTLDYNSNDNQNTFNLEYNCITNKNTHLNFGISGNNTGIKVNDYSLFPNVKTLTVDTSRFENNFSMNQLGIFFQLSKSHEKFNYSIGLRSDISSYNTVVSKLYNQLSPRISFSYKLFKNFHINLHSGIYNQYPLMTLLSYRNNNGNYLNSDSLKYMKCFHNIIGVDYTNDKNLKISIEFFSKIYSNIPFLLKENLVLPNTVSFISQQSLGLSPANSSGFGRCYGMEILFHQKLWNKYYGIIAYTLMKSEYSNNGIYLSSNWDYRHTVSFTGGKLFQKNWEVGIKLRVNSGSPYTPLNYNASSVKNIFDLNPLGVIDLSKLNSSRFPFYNALDLRIEKKYVFQKVIVNIFFDVQNVYNTSPQVPPFLRQLFDKDGNALSSPQDPSKYLLEITNFTPPFNILPTLGILINTNW